ncbi:MAG: hypothetical protein ACJA1C_002256 [Crocinitomicaceae bacterium]|jgi:hypothetical protein
MTNFKLVFLLACSFLFLIACSEKPVEKEPAKKKNTTTEAYQDDNEEFEKYISQIDDSTTLNIGNSLFYSHSDKTSYELAFKVNDDDQILRMTEKYTVTEGGSIMSNVFYYKDKRTYASKEYFEEGVGDEAHFVERVTYYDENSKPILTKKRTAPYEDYLDQSSFTLATTQSCSDERAFRALTQQDEFETNFRGFVDEGAERYIMVGENKQGGYETALLLQKRTPFLSSLYQNQESKIGMKLQVTFRTMKDPAGYEYQALLDAAEVVEEKKIH